MVLTAGLIVGGLVGTRVGLDVGEAVGPIVGADVGDTVGNVVGLPVGPAVGLAGQSPRPASLALVVPPAMHLF